MLIVMAVKKTGFILLQSSPTGVKPGDVKHDLEQVREVPFTLHHMALADDLSRYPASLPSTNYTSGV